MEQQPNQQTCMCGAAVVWRQGERGMRDRALSRAKPAGVHANSGTSSSMTQVVRNSCWRLA